MTGDILSFNEAALKRRRLNEKNLRRIAHENASVKQRLSVEYIMDLHARGWSNAKIAEDLGLFESTVRQVINKQVE